MSFVTPQFIAQIPAVDRSAAVQISTLAEAMSDPEDAEELYGALASLWLELRLQWQRHNDVAGSAGHA